MPGRNSPSWAGRWGRSRLWRGLTILSVLMWTGCGTAPPALLPPPASLPAGLTVVDWQAAQEQFSARYGRPADASDTWSWLAEQAIAEQQRDQARFCFAQIPTSHPEYGMLARYQQGRLALHQDLAGEAEQQLNEFLRESRTRPPADPRLLRDARQRLRYLLEIELRFEERAQWLATYADDPDAEPFEVLAACFPSLLRWNGPEAAATLTRWYEKNPQQLELAVALTRYLTGQGQLDDAAARIHPWLKSHPESLSVQAANLAIAAEANRWEEVRERLKPLPPYTDSEPWLLTRIRVAAALQAGEAQQALELANAGLKQDRTSAELELLRGRAAGQVRDSSQKTAALHRAAELSRIQGRLGWALNRPDDPAPIAEIGRICAELNLDLEQQRMEQLRARLEQTSGSATGTPSPAAAAANGDTPKSAASGPQKVEAKP